MATNYSDILQDPAYPSDYPASVGWVLRQIVTGRSLVEGYLYQGAFYADSAHTTAITATKERIYVDLSSGTAFRWTGSAYVTISVSSASDLSAVHYTADEVSESQQEIARTNIGAADATTVSTLSTTVARLVGKESAWDAKEGAITYDANPTANSTNCVKSGGIFSWVTNLFTNLTLALTTKADTATTYSKDETYSRAEVIAEIAARNASHLLEGKTFATPTSDRERTNLICYIIRSLGGNVNSEGITPGTAPESITMTANDGTARVLKIVTNSLGEYTTEVS